MSQTNYNLSFSPSELELMAEALETIQFLEIIFKAKKDYLENIEGIGTVRAKSIKEFEDFNEAEKEIDFIEKYKIQPLFITDKNYPQRLLNCYDPPTLLYYRGTADLNASKIISIVGTRSNTDYGKQVTEKLVTDLADQNVPVVNGITQRARSPAAVPSVFLDDPVWLKIISEPIAPSRG